MNLDITKLNIKGEFALPISVLCILAMVILPLPTFFLDFFFTLSLVLSLLILAKAINVDRPLAFSTFPAVILIATLLRLAMNVASTRVILLEGHNGPDAAGSVIESFGDFVIGGEYAVGMIVFSILVVINFIVITKGTGRISEVSARFKLDSLPGKQMAIDADVNAGNITPEQAQDMRADLQAESDFYGSMDGASKFVKGDAIAGIVILLINIVGGLTLGVASHDLSISEAAQTYILLTIGDGIVAQIPGLILSVATGIIITRAGKKETLGDQVKTEFLSGGKNFYIAGGIILALGLIPGMPNIAFIAFAAVVFLLGYYLERKQFSSKLPSKVEVPDIVKPSLKEVDWGDIAPVTPLEIKIGYGLIEWIKKDESTLINLLKGMRKSLSVELGFLIAPIPVRDDLSPSMGGYQYSIKIFGEEDSSFELHTSKFLALGSGISRLSGLSVREPAFNSEAKWIKTEEKGVAESFGCRVFPPQKILLTHLKQVVKSNASLLFGYDEAKNLLDSAGRAFPELVSEYKSKFSSNDSFVKVMRMLLDEGVPLTNMSNILRVFIDEFDEKKSLIFLQQDIRNALGRSILNSVFGKGQDVEFITLESELQQQMLGAVYNSNGEDLAFESTMVDVLINKLAGFVEARKVDKKPAALLVHEHLRRQFNNVIGSRVKGLHVIGLGELPPKCDFEIIETITS